MAATGIEDYYSKDKLEVYKALMTNPKCASLSTRYYSIYQSLPSLQDKIVFDIPCGLGFKCRKFIAEYGASKVIGADIVEKQLELAKEADSEVGISSDKIQYVCHDGKIPQELCQADVCIAVHLFCFAENFEELMSIAKCAFVNLKPGVEFRSISCSMCKENTAVIKEKAKDFDLTIEVLEEWSGDIHVPRKMVSKMDDFKFEVFVWDSAAIVKALDQVGFKSVQLLPYQSDPDYCGEYNLQKYIKLIDGRVITAVK